MVLVFEAIRKWVSAAGGVCLPSSVVPTVALNCALRRANLDECAGDEHLLGGHVHDGLKRGRIDALERGRCRRGTRVVVVSDPTVVEGADEQPTITMAAHAVIPAILAM